MTYNDYRASFDTILEEQTSTPPYDNPDFLEYVKLNIARHDRWIKKGEIPTALQSKVRALSKQTWILITEAWCGDAAHITPFVKMLADLNPNIHIEVQLRDEESEIQSYLTNGGASIPILIARKPEGEDIFVWGPRPLPAQEIHIKNLNSDLPVLEKKKELQGWYNKDKGQTLLQEISELI